MSVVGGEGGGGGIHLLFSVFKFYNFIHKAYKLPHKNFHVHSTTCTHAYITQLYMNRQRERKEGQLKKTNQASMLRYNIVRQVWKTS